MYIVVGQVQQQTNTVTDVQSNTETYVVLRALGALNTHASRQLGKACESMVLDRLYNSLGGGPHVDFPGGGFHGRGGHDGGDLHATQARK